MVPPNNHAHFHCEPNVLNQSAWYIDARYGAFDQRGDVDPVPMDGTLLGLTGDVVAVSLLTNEGDPNQSLLYTDDSAALGLTGAIDLRWSAGAIDDPSNNGGAPQSYKVAKLVVGAATPEYGASILLTGAAAFVWTDDSDIVHSQEASAAATMDPYSHVPQRVTFDPTTGTAIAYVGDDDAPTVTTADGRGWRQVGTGTFGPTTVRANTSLLTFLLGKGYGEWMQVYDGIDRVLVSDVDIDRDAPGGLSVGDTFTAGTGETWTLGGSTGTFDCNRPGWIVGDPGSSADGPFTVPDAPALDLGTADFTVAALIQPASIADGGSDFRLVYSKAAGNIGATGVGWAFIDYSPLGGVCFVVNDGTSPVTGPHAAGAWTAGEWHLCVATGDRDGNLSFYIDNMATPVSTASMAAVGTLSNAADVTAAEVDPALLGASAVWPEVLTSAQLLSLPTYLGVPA